MVWIIYIVLGFLGVLGLSYIVSYWARNRLKRKFLAAMRQSGRVCLTFDDGPNPESTHEILDLLDELQIKATFFLVGRNVRKHPELCRAIIEQNHEVGDHGYRHVHAWACFPFCAMIDLMRGRSAVKKELNNMDSFWLRPPYGKLNLTTLCYALMTRRKLAFWNVDPHDYLAQPVEQLYTRVLKHFKGGSVILLHETSLQSNKALAGNLAAIKLMVQEIKKRGYTFATISQAVPEYN